MKLPIKTYNPSDTRDLRLTNLSTYKLIAGVVFVVSFILGGVFLAPRVDYVFAKDGEETDLLPDLEKAPIGISGATGQEEFVKNTATSISNCAFDPTSIAADAVDAGIGAGAKAAGEWVIDNVKNKAGEFLGQGIIDVFDGEKVVKEKRLRLDNCIRDIQENAFRVMKARFLQRMSDNIVDGVIDWIQNGKRPRFSDIGEMIENSADAAVGDTLIEVGLGNFCSPLQKSRIQFILEKPGRFSQQVQCTLTGAVGNITQFYNDFDAGGWIGFQEVLKPQNNRWGQLMLTMDEVSRRQDEEEKKRIAVYGAGGGFDADVRCIGWTNLDALPYGKELVLTEGSSVTLFGTAEWPPKGPDGLPVKGFDDPKTPPPIKDDDITGDGIADTWTCAKTETISPPGYTQAALASALTADTIKRSPPLDPYADAILDAVILRVGKSGLAYAKKSLSNQKAEENLKKSGTPNPTPEEIRAKDANDAYAEIQEIDAASSGKIKKEDILEEIGSATDKLPERGARKKIADMRTLLEKIKNDPEYGEYLDALGKLKSCQDEKLKDPKNACLVDTTEKLDAVNAFVAGLPEQLENLSGLEKQLDLVEEDVNEHYDDLSKSALQTHKASVGAVSGSLDVFKQALDDVDLIDVAAGKTAAEAELKECLAPKDGVYLCPRAE